MILRIIDNPNVAEPFRNYQFSFNKDRDFISCMGPHPMIYINDEDGDLDFAIQSCYVRFEKCETMEEYEFLDDFVSPNISKHMLFIEPCESNEETPVFYGDSIEQLVGGRTKEFAYKQIFYEVMKSAVEETGSKIFVSQETPEGKYALDGVEYESIAGVIMIFMAKLLSEVDIYETKAGFCDE